jgi:nitrite reductase/ring-hydroxylating ferredoxin subunit
MKLRLCHAAEVVEGSMLQVKMLGHTPFAVYRVNGRFYVTEDTCTHGKASLADEGELEGFTVTCTWHDGRFDIRTGAVLAAPCTHPIKAFPATVDNDAVWVEVD